LTIGSATVHHRSIAPTGADNTRLTGYFRFDKFHD
jgi:hypothetical protein